MTDEEARQETSAESGSAGQMLREARENLQLSIQQVAERLRLRQQIVSDLEQDKFDKYVAGTFTRGYIRSYARLLKIDENKVLSAYGELDVDNEPQMMQSFSRRRRLQSQDNRLMLVTYVIGAVIIGSAVIFWLQNNSQTDDDVTSQPEQDSVAERIVQAQDVQVEIEPAADEAAPITTQAPVLVDTSVLEQNRPAQTDTETDIADNPDETTSTQPPQATEQESEQAGIADTTDTLDEAAETQAADAESTESFTPAQDDEPNQTHNNALPDAELVLRFQGDAWIRIEDASGEAIAFGVKPEGHVSALNGQPPYDITLGAPENVSLYFQGEQIELSSYRAGRVARLTVPATE